MIRTTTPRTLILGLVAAGTLAAAADDVKTQAVDVGGLTFKAPAAWAKVTPTSAMRKAQMKVAPVEGDSAPAELVVFVFPGGAGSAQANVDRWQKQFKDPSGATPSVESASVKGSNTEVTRVEVAGTYTDSFSKAGPQAGYRLLGAIVESKDAGYFLKLTGPDKTVLAAEKDFDGLIASMTLKK